MPVGQLKLLVFDLGGTLIDSAQDLCNSVNATLEQFGRPHLSDSIIAGYIGNGALTLIRRAFAADDGREPGEELLAEAYKFFLDYYREHKLDCTYAYEGVLEAPKGELPDDWEPTEMTLFRSTEFGDDQDRPVRKADGGLTYFGTDLAYHAQKAETADMLIDIWGADHAGTVKRIQAAVKALTHGETPFDIKLVQMVRLMRAGEPVKMSKRSGKFITIADMVEEVGKDVVRFTMLARKADAQMDFDFAKVVEASKDNPVFYVQYAHARIASLHRRAAEAGMNLPPADLSLLDEEELALVKLAAQFPRIVEGAANAHEPHRIAFYLYDLAAAFHSLWHRGNDDPARRFLVVEDAAVTAARLALADAIGQVIRNGLGVMGVAAAEEM